MSHCAALGTTVTIVALATGCSPSSDADKDSQAVTEAATGAEVASDDDHSGWWCVAHGVPEAECAQCDSALIAQFKQNDDWCDEHDRPESQCFVCDATRFDRFAARYEAKFGKRSPEPAD